MIRRILAFLFDAFVIFLVTGTLTDTPLNPNREALDALEDDSAVIVERLKENLSAEEVTEEVKKDQKEIYELYYQYLSDYNRISIYDQIITSLGILLYFVAFPYFFDGQTPGKKIARIKLVTKEGKKVGIGMLILRATLLYTLPLTVISLIGAYTLNPSAYFNLYTCLYLASSIWNIVLLISTTFSKDKRGIHDIICKTRVLSEE